MFHLIGINIKFDVLVRKGLGLGKPINRIYNQVHRYVLLLICALCTIHRAKLNLAIMFIMQAGVLIFNTAEVPLALDSYDILCDSKNTNVIYGEMDIIALSKKKVKILTDMSGRTKSDTSASIVGTERIANAY